MGSIGRFTATDGVRYPRGSRVICRTRRGLEVGEVLAPEEASAGPADGNLLRRMAVEDELLVARLRKNRDEAWEACSRLLDERRLNAVLIDVEHLFDGEALIFHFLGNISPEIEALTGELAATYETKVQFRQFAETLSEGCGPGCGTDEAAGHCGTGCAGCAIASACKAH